MGPPRYLSDSPGYQSFTDCLKSLVLLLLLFLFLFVDCVITSHMTSKFQCTRDFRAVEESPIANSANQRLSNPYQGREREPFWKRPKATNNTRPGSHIQTEANCSSYTAINLPAPRLLPPGACDDAFAVGFSPQCGAGGSQTMSLPGQQCCSTRNGCYRCGAQGVRI